MTQPPRGQGPGSLERPTTGSLPLASSQGPAGGTIPLPLGFQMVSLRPGGRLGRASRSPHLDPTGTQVLSQGAVTGVLEGKEEQGPADKVSLELKGREERLPARPRRHRGLEGGEGSGC